jgi:NADPH:quinone reductase-like Zn-dependent oxidoreductase
LKAHTFHKPGGIANIQTRDVSDAGSPSAGEIRVRLRATSLNAHDYHVALGNLPSQEGRILMADGAGIVEEVGEGVGEFSVGDRVISTFFPDWATGIAPAADFARTPGDGLDGYAVDAVVRPANFFTKAPNGWDFTEAATLPTAGLTAWRALKIVTDAGNGKTVLLLGTGGVSVLALQMAKALGCRVIVTSSSDEKLDKARELGADILINYTTGQWVPKVLAATDGCGVDITVEMGGAGTLPLSIEATRIGGSIVLVGLVTGVSGTVPIVELMKRQQRIHGIIVGSRKHQEEMVQALNTLELRPFVDRTFRFGDIREAFEFLGSGQHFGKLAIEY